MPVASPFTRPAFFWGLAFVVGLAFWLRAGQSSESLWLDELHTSWVVADGVQPLLPRAAVGNHSPVYFALVWAVIQGTGPGEFGLRLVSIVAGTALVAGVCLAVVRWTQCWAAGLLAAVLVALDRHCVFYAQEARPYALVQLVALLHLVVFACLVARPRAALRVAWIASGALLFYLHYTAALVFAAELVYYGLVRLMRRRFPADGACYRGWQLAADLAWLGLCLLPAVSHLWGIAQRRQDWSAFVPARAWWRIWEIGDVFPLDVYVLVPLAILAAAWISVRWFRLGASAPVEGRTRTRDEAKRREGLVLVLCWFVVPVVVAWAATSQGAAPLFFRRYLMVSAVAPMLGAAWCCAACPTAFWRAVLAVAVVGLSISRGGMVAQWQQDGRVVGARNQDWRAAVEYLRAEARTDVPIFVRSGLIEAERWYDSPDPLHREYCLLPVLGLYRLDHRPEALFPLPIRPPAVLSADARRRVAECGQAWCLILGSETSVARFEQALRSAWPRDGVPPASVRRVRFRQVAVLHVTIRVASPGGD